MSFNYFLFSALLCEILSVVIVLVAGLKVEVALLILPFIVQLGFVHFEQILVILGIIL